MEVVIVALIVVLAVAGGTWSVNRAFKGKGGCNCGQKCESCDDERSDGK